MREQLQVGDIVTLKSGGPEMTIESIYEIEGKQMAQCQWFDGKKPFREKFPLTSLQKSD